MNHLVRDPIEHAIRRHLEASNLGGATTAALEGVGQEIFRFLLALHRDEAAASDVFSVFSEGIWRGIDRFDWECSLRTWAFGIAYRASLRYRRDPGRRAAREIPLDQCSAIESMEQQIRMRTLSSLETERRDRFAEICDALPPDDRALLILRTGRQLAWDDCARAMSESDEPLDDEGVKRESARLRERYELVKEKLLEIGRRASVDGEPIDR